MSEIDGCGLLDRTTGLFELKNTSLGNTEAKFAFQAAESTMTSVIPLKLMPRLLVIRIQF